MRRKKIFQLTFSILFSTLLVIGLVYAWTAPTQNPPAGNVEAPINVSDSAQSKLGNFGLGGGEGQSLYWLKNIGGTLYFSSTDPSGDRVVIGQDGNVGIGKNDPQAKLHVNGRIKAQDPIDDDDVATKAYVDAHSGEVRWAGYTSAAYTGNLGGPKGANQKCDAEYPGSHWCSVDEIMRLGMDYPYTYTVWVRDAVKGGSMNNYDFTFLGGAGGHYCYGDINECTCYGWTNDTSENASGPVLTYDYGRIIDYGCKYYKFRLACCY